MHEFTQGLHHVPRMGAILGSHALIPSHRSLEASYLSLLATLQIEEPLTTFVLGHGRTIGPHDLGNPDGCTQHQARNEEPPRCLLFPCGVLRRQIRSNERQETRRGRAEPRHPHEQRLECHEGKAGPEAPEVDVPEPPGEERQDGREARVATVDDVSTPRGEPWAG